MTSRMLEYSCTTFEFSWYGRLILGSSTPSSIATSWRRPSASSSRYGMPICAIRGEQKKRDYVNLFFLCCQESPFVQKAPIFCWSRHIAVIFNTGSEKMGTKKNRLNSWYRHIYHYFFRTGEYTIKFHWQKQTDMYIKKNTIKIFVSENTRLKFRHRKIHH